MDATKKKMTRQYETEHRNGSFTKWFKFLGFLLILKKLCSRCGWVSNAVLFINISIYVMLFVYICNVYIITLFNNVAPTILI